jgi:hypothetical protein
MDEIESTFYYIKYIKVNIEYNLYHEMFDSL